MLSLKTKVEIARSTDLADKFKKFQTDSMNDTSGAFWNLKENNHLHCSEISRVSNLEQSPLYGLLVGVKDLFHVKDTLTTAGSKCLQTLRSPFNSTVWEQLSQSGACFAAKCSMDEFAMGSFTNTSSMGKCSIPGFPERTAGGSSGGSAAALKAGLVDFSIGSDTGGSIRLPASYCGVVGFKPSYGALSRFGMIQYASSLDQAGFFTNNLTDLDFILSSTNILHYSDKNDPLCTGTFKCDKSPPAKTIGWFPFVFNSLGISDQVKTAYADLLEKLKSEVTLIQIDIPELQFAASVYYIIACAEACSNLSRYQGIYYGNKLTTERGNFWEQVTAYRSTHFGTEVKKRIMLGNFILSSENFSTMYDKAIKIRQLLTFKLNRCFSNCDLIVLPSATSIAPTWDEIGKLTSAEIYASDLLTVPFSLAGLPAVSVPYTEFNGLSIGMQWVGKRYFDTSLISQIKPYEYL